MNSEAIKCKVFHIEVQEVAKMNSRQWKIKEHKGIEKWIKLKIQK